MGMQLTEGGSISNRRWVLSKYAGSHHSNSSEPEDVSGASHAPSYAIAELSHFPCLVLLGQPGMGKTTQAIQAVGHLTSLSELADYLNVGRAPDPVEALSELLTSTNCKNAATGRDWHIFLDGVDETGLPPIRFVQILDDFVANVTKVVNRVNLKIRFLCRTAAWTDTHERLVEARWREDEVRKLQIGPLTQEDIKTEVSLVAPEYAEAFLQSIKENGTGELATSPILLRILLDLFVSTGNFPPSRVKLYHLGVARLLAADRTSIHVGERGNQDRKLMVAARVAAAMAFSGFNAISLDSASTEAVPLVSLAGGPEPAPSGGLPVTMAELSSVVASSLFTRLDADNFEWAHRSFMEFFAAHYIVERRLPAEEMWRLVSVEDPDGRKAVSPSLREIAAWLASMSPAYFELLIEMDPEVLLRSDVAAAAPDDRRLLIEALFERLAAGQLLDVYRSVYPYINKLMHPAIEAQLSARLLDTNQSVTVRRMAIEIAKENALCKLLPSLISVACNEGDDVLVRTAAVSAVDHLGGAAEKSQLVQILKGSLSSDKYDELRGAVLQATWPDVLNVGELLSALTPPKDNNLIGYYAFFLHKLEFNACVDADITFALAWLARTLALEDGNAWHFDEGRILSRIFWVGAAHIGDGNVRHALADLFVANFRGITRHILHASPQEFTGWPDANALRQQLVVDIITRATDPSTMAMSLVVHAGNLIRADDIGIYLKAIAANEYPRLKPAFISIVGTLAQQLSINTLDEVWEVAQGEPLLQSALMRNFSTDLSSPEMEWQRSRWQREQAAKQALEASNEVPKTERRIIQLLDQIDNGDKALWWQLNLLLFVSPDGRYSDQFEFRGDLRATPGWKALAAVERHRIVEGAIAYLAEVRLDSLRWLGTNTSLRPALAGYRALRLLLAEKTEALDNLQTSVWQNWAAVTVGFFENDFYTEADAQKRLLSMAYAKAPCAVLRAIDRVALGPKSRGLGTRELELLEAIVDSTILGHLTVLSDKPTLKGNETRAKLAAFLIRHGDRSIVDRVRGMLEVATTAPSVDGSAEAAETSTERSDTRWLVEVAARILVESPNDIWFELLALTRKNSHLARAIWNAFADSWAFNDAPVLSTVSAYGLAQAYIDLTHLFPEASEPVGRVRELTLLDHVDRVKGRLLGNLVAAGTHEAFRQLDRLEVEAPHISIAWRLEEARRNFRLKAITHRSPAQVLSDIALVAPPLVVKPVPSDENDSNESSMISASLVQEVPSEPAISVPDVQASAVLFPDQRLRLLSYATEWSSGNGGISTLNRELCVALAALGHEVWCLVPDASESEIQDACSSNVTLQPCPPAYGIDDKARLLLGDEYLKDTVFDAVIGHDHITGPYACAKAKSRGAKYIHFLHTVPQESETLKTRNSGNGQLLKGETKRKMQVSLSKQASLVVAIGPKIFAYASLQLDGVPLLHNMMPGLNSTLLKHVPDQAKLVRNHCLLTGRMEDASLKGIELGCEAVLAAYEKGWLAGKYPKLIVRGFDEENADTQLTNVVDVERFADILQPREYTADRVVAYADLTSVSLLMMPSRSEAFGLTAYEAIAAGIPTLISDESGLAEYIQDAMDRRIVDKSYAETMICPARAASAKPIWAPRIVEILSNKEAAFARAENLRRQLRPILSWENAARALTNKILSV